MGGSSRVLVDRTFVVCIGVDEVPGMRLDRLLYAAKDARDVATEFGHENRGIADPIAGNIRCLDTPESTTYRQIVETLAEASEQCEENDLLVVYYAGHGVPDRRVNEVYLATSDMTVLPTGRCDPTRSLSLSYLVRHVFRPCRGYTLFILDSCFSGSYAEEEAIQRRLSEGAERFMLRQLEDVDRHYAMLSCKASAQSREDGVRRQGLFTHYLLRGMRGDDPSVVNPDGQVTAARLFLFIGEENDTQPPVDISSPYKQRLVLSHPGRRRPARVSGAAAVAAAPESAWVVEPLSNPLGGAPVLIDQIVRALASSPDVAGSTSAATTSAIRVLREVTGASHARFFHHTLSSDAEELLAFSSGADPLPLLPPGFMRTLAGSVAADKLRTADGFSVRLHGGARSISAGVIAIPTALRSANDLDVLLLDGVEPDSPWRGDLGATLVRGAITFVQTPAVVRRGESLEAALIDSLKATYGRVPAGMYERRFELFRRELGVQDFVFEPIVEIDPDPANVRIDSWEALARDPDRPSSVPQHLFDAAEMWGRRFIIELDSVFLDRAVGQYLEAYRRTPPEERDNVRIQKLSVNVYPESIVSEAYRRAVGEVLRTRGVDPKLLVLELSEKRPLVRPDDLDRGRSTLDLFNEALDLLAQHAPGISFAIDDFGVGHASLDRLAKLRLAHVKIDREVLFHDAAVKELALVNEITQRIGRATNKVVVEGFDGTAPIGLDAIKSVAHINFVQGWLFPFASPFLSRLPDELRRDVAREVREGRS